MPFAVSVEANFGKLTALARLDIALLLAVPRGARCRYLKKNNAVCCSNVVFIFLTK